MKTKKLTALLAAGFVLAGSFASAGSAWAAGISSAEQARQKALQKVPNAVVTDVDLDRENGQQVYEIELVKGSKKYDMTYRASDGKLLAYGWEKTTVSPSSSRSLISTSKCRQLASNKVKNGTITAISQKVDDGIDIYKVKMTAGNKRYTLKYHARTGALLECKWELAASASSSTQGGKIGLEKAKQIALDAVPGATVYKAEYDVDDGVAVYEVELIKGNYEYEFKIDANTGAILEQDKDWRD
ncbi:MAG: PepSY domain-containing protein [Eubacterium sp.]|nr:PepSY domain-containing protein [Eubacterium sp.]